MQKSTKYKMNIGIGALIALIYVVLPIDLLPDAIPVTGWIDDLIAVLIAITNGLVWGAKLKRK
ncbi:MAG: DUF1232 domain-containing protein [Paludibacteraceae bacterium]|nr:DUF1232 domain-containing protein [Paludibacteraceae bacterium]MBR4704576.1 DUF1232 domain-containing protein [Paludibacteraceae bacterium]